MPISDLPPAGLCRLIYASRWTDPTRRELDQTVRTVLATSIQNNRLCDVTGLLLVHDGWFVQALEGPAGSVRQTYHRIGGDPRHADLQVLAAGPASRREFQNWNMCERRLASGDQAVVAPATRNGAFDPTGLSPEASLAMLRGVGAAHAV